MNTAKLEQIAVNVRLVVVGQHSRSQTFDTVTADDELGAQLVVDHLVEHGHRRIAFVMHANGRGDETRQECHRLHGFRRAMTRYGLDSEAIVLDSRWSLDGGRDAARQIDALD